MSTRHMNWLARGMQRWNVSGTGDSSTDVMNLGDEAYPAPLRQAVSITPIDPEPQQIVIVHADGSEEPIESIDEARQKLRLARIHTRTASAAADQAREDARQARGETHKARAEMEASRHRATQEQARLRGSKARKGRSYEEAETLEDVSGYGSNCPFGYCPDIGI